MNRLPMIAMLLLLASPAWADGICAEAQTQSELNDCAARAYAAADAELNAVYKQILVEYADEPLFLQKLKAAQKLWLRLRDAEVEAKFPVARAENPRVAWGSAYPMSVGFYLAELTRARTRHLKAWLEGAREGDLSAGSVHTKTH